MTLAKACGLGAASSSCSYAAVAIARSVFRKGAKMAVVSGDPSAVGKGMVFQKA